MGDKSPPPSMDLSNSAVVAISAKIMVVAIITLFFFVVFCLFVSLYLKWQYSASEDPNIVSWRRRTARQGQPAAVSARRRGLNSATLKSLPIMVYNPKDFKDGLECAVCLSELSEGEKARLLPKCNHGFHVECIDMWFKSHSTCPLCRNPVVSANNQTSNSNTEQQEVRVDIAPSNSDSDSDSDSGSDNERFHDAAEHAGEAPAFPTNVLFWGNESQVRSHGEATNAAAASTSSAASSNNVGVGRQRDELVIEIPKEHYDDCLSSPPSATHSSEQEEAKTPVVSRLRSLKRLLSRGKRMATPTYGSSSAEVEPA